ncbi:multidrug effflux MFS transporter [Devosia sp. ZB163]|uniref:multidrug effflux MFS transporter n=1 Tax=Devosia sp. ZB163 TaxID=3025938 RepID=UPI0023619509|nr:multidrug effflux MFS transporter [Devosia sp. ZB163]MDC9824466.1 multidrug effflux MFS transporter [Devosia sp. ZB163]
MSSHPLSKPEFVAIVAALMIVDALAIDIMLPALPNIGDTFAVLRENDRSLVITVFIIGFGLPQIFFGPLVDRFGRRRPILWGLAAYIVCALAGAVAPSFLWLLILRFLQGTAAAAVRVGLNATIRDRYSGKEMAEVLSLVLSIFLLVPIIMPTVGQLIILAAPWQYIFVAMAAIAAATWVWTFLRLGETQRPEDRRSLDFGVVAEGFLIVLRNRRAFFYGVAAVFLQGAILGMVVTTQQIFTEIYPWGVFYPLSMVIIAGSAAITSLIASRVLGRIGLRRCSHGGSILIPVITFGAALVSLGPGLPDWGFLLAMVLLAPCIVPSFAGSGALSMEPLGEVAGTAAAVFGLFQMVFGALLGFGIAQAYDGTVIPLLVGMGVMGICAFGCFAIAERGRMFGRDQAPAPVPVEAF